MAEVPRVERTDQFLDKVLEGRYRVVSELGQGGMSTVYRAQQVEGGADVAVKILHDELIHDQSQRERFEREARALFALDDENILHVHDYGVHEGLPFLVMELLEGKTLDLLVEDAPLPPAEGVDLVRQVLSGLAAAHAQGVLHRDLKTENVVVVTRPDGTRVAKLLDFGLVKFVDDERWGEGRALTAFGEVMGTPAYMSPEQCTGETADARSDVYAMGAVLFEMLTGEWPFMEESRGDMMRAHLTTPTPKVAERRPELDPRPELQALIDRAMAKDVEERFADAGAMLAALEAIPHPVATVRQQLQGPSAAGNAAPLEVNRLTEPMRLPSLPPTAGRPAPVARLVLIGGGLLVLLVAAAVAAFMVLSSI
ncbi:MAG: serine/threonine protein kinase [Deltaproteobacteria bacterium]|nr:serine/threonine protein kinase [Deltaproteobacteria bacterium]